MNALYRILSVIVLVCVAGAVYMLVQPGASAPSAPTRPIDVRAELAGAMVAPDQSTYDDAGLAEVKYFAFYYSAGWCGPCRQFTPQLVAWYKHTKPLFPQMEIIFVSNDKDAEAMAGYMAADAMPWPALRYDAIRTKPDILAYEGRGIPCLVLVDEQGTILADTNVGGKYVGPASVVDAMNELAKAHIAEHAGP